MMSSNCQRTVQSSPANRSQSQGYCKILINVTSVLMYKNVGWAIDLPPRGAPCSTHTHMAKKPINRQLTSNYHDPTVFHIPPLPQYSPHLTFFSTFVSVSLTSVNHSSVPPLDFCDFDVPRFREARSQLKG
nr:hypothetical transcript [Hymenolepis microstoma]